ncbi:hypothetical protein [Micromonospora narathiwatensis]|nr:hypothetical protein [Micromonospora narathiwatensis]
MLLGELPGAGIRMVQALAQEPGISFLLTCGFELEASRPAALRLDLTDGATWPPPRLDRPISAARPPPR